jgi:CPA2 family monovalent cation:H+ antiporter-2
MNDILSIVILVGIISLVTNIFLHKFDTPPILGYIFSGAIISILVHINAQDEYILSHIAEFGIIFLMFTIGLELKIENLKELKKQVFVFGGLQVVVSIVVFATISYYIFDFDIKKSFVIASALALSSTAIVLKMLNDNNSIATNYGQNTLGILIFQDLAVIPILLMITIMVNSQSSLSSMLLTTIISAFGLIMIMILLGKYILEPILDIVTKTNIDELFILTILLVTICTSYLAHMFGFTYSLGAFIGGMLIAETHFKHQVEADLIPFRDLLLAVFFVTVGMQIDIYFLFDHIFYIVCVAILIMIIKAIIIYSIVQFSSKKTIALQTALAILQVGEFSFVIFTQATSSKLIDAQTGQFLTLSVIISMLITPFIVKNIKNIVYLIFKKEKKTILATQTKQKQLTNHTIVCGYGTFGKIIIENLKSNNTPYVVIIDNFELFEEAIRNNENAIFGDPTQKAILLKAGIKDAKIILIALHSLKLIEIISHTSRYINNKIKIIAKVNHKDAVLLGDTLQDADLIDVYYFAADIMTTRAQFYLNDMDK